MMKKIGVIIWSFKYLMLVVGLRFLKGVSAFKVFFLAQDTGYPNIVKKLENKFKILTVHKHAVAFNSATSAMNAAFYAMAANEATRVGTVGLVIPSSYQGARIFGSRICYIDVCPDTLRIDVIDLEEKIKQLDILIVVHYYGYPCDLPAIVKLCDQHNVKLIEDCSHSHGAKVNDEPVGSFGDISVFSLQGAKAVSGGEGGIAVTSDDLFLGKLIEYGHQDKRTYDIPTDYERFSLFGLGHKLRIHPVAAAAALIDLKFLSIKNNLYREVMRRLGSTLRESQNIAIPLTDRNTTPAGYCQGITLICSDNASANALMACLKKASISFFQRNYANNMIENSQSVRNPSYSDIAFSLIVYIDMKQFINPFRFLRLLKILSNQ